MSIRLAAFSLVSFLPGLALAQERPGYTDTPILPNSEWRVHDAARPYPAVVSPPPASGPVAPPADAVVLFDGTDLSGWTGRDDEARWKVQDGYVEVNGTGDIRTRAQFGDCQMHIEWAAPAEVKGKGQGRGNSGAYFMGRYEVQILDSFENPTYADGQAASLYGQFPPMVNASRGPGEWQTYDIVFIAPRFDGDRLVSPARFTVFHNGVLVHHDRAMLGASTHRRLPKYGAHPEKGPLKLQDHGNPVRYRNIWVRELDGSASRVGAPEEIAGSYTLDTAVMRESLEAVLEKRDELPEGIAEMIDSMLETFEQMSATMDVKADGTWTASSQQGERERISEGIWRIDGDKIVFTQNDSPQGPRPGVVRSGALWFEEEVAEGVTMTIVLRRTKER